MRENYQHMTNDDHVLSLLIKNRDKQAFTVVYQKYHTYLYALAMRYLKSAELAEDAVQHIFVKLWENTKNIEININLKNYLYTMTKNYILNQIRNHKETLSIYYADAQQEISDEDTSTNYLEDLQISAALYRAIDALPPQKKEVCRLKLQEHISNQEIAEKMGISVHTVKSHYQESIKMIRIYFGKKSILLLIFFHFCVSI
jgi:RNA polymerase sigma-70 factor (ECF subfamily)